MKRLWTLLVLALAVSAASIPETGWAQSSTNVENITVEELGLKGMLATGIAINDSGHIFVSIGNVLTGDVDRRYVWRTKDTGRIWVQLKNGLEGIPFGSARTIAVVDSSYLLVGSMEDIFKSTDNGESWQMVKASGSLGTERNVRPSQFLRKGNTIFVVGYNSGFWRSDDNGWNFQQVSLVDSTFPYVQAITMTPSGTLFAGTGSADKGTGVFRSTDDGETWVAANNGLDNGMPGAYSSLNIWRLAACPSGSSGTVIATTEYAGVYRTDDEGDNWYKVENLPIFIGGPAIICSPHPGMFVGDGSISKGAVYRSVDGVNWAKIPELNGYSIWSFAQFSSNKLLVGTHDGVFLLTFTGVSVEDPPTIPSAFALAQNYPNPFNPSTTIEFSLPERSFVKLIVTNLLGQEIETVVSAVKEPGVHHATWNGSKYPSGVYLYRLETKGFVSTRKMLLVK